MEEKFQTKVDLSKTKTIGPSGEVWAGSEISIRPADVVIESGKVGTKGPKRRRKKKKKKKKI